MRKLLVGCLTLCVAVGGSAVASSLWHGLPTMPQPVAPYEVVVTKDIRVPMRDGTKLALDLYLPAKDGKPVEGKHPTLLARTPYNKNGQAAEARWFAARGYAVVL